MTPDSVSQSQPDDRPRAARRPTARGLALAVGAGCMYGAWALWANLEHGAAAGWRAATTQFVVSFIVTLAITTVMEQVHGSLSSRPGRIGGAIAASVGTTIVFTLSLHLASGTPEIAATVVPVLLLGSVYCVAYVANLERERARRLALQGSR
jgi:hypothetical protein